MFQSFRNESRRVISTSAVVCTLIFGLVFVPRLYSFENQEPRQTRLSQALLPGEMLAYDVSWSNMLRAGTAVMEVRQETLPKGKQVLAFILTGRSRGLLNKVFPVNDTVRSIFDPEIMQSLSFDIAESFGKKKRYRSAVFDRSQNTVVCRLGQGTPETWSVPARVQDGLASLYYLRTKTDFTIGKVFAIDVYDSGKNWSIEVHTLGREKVKTPAGEFSTIKVKTRPLYEGAFQNKGEVFIWLTDDSRKIPVLMKSTIRIGSFVFMLKNVKPGVA